MIKVIHALGAIEEESISLVASAMFLLYYYDNISSFRVEFEGKYFNLNFSEVLGAKLTSKMIESELEWRLANMKDKIL